jgi:hypothetical protein
MTQMMVDINVSKKKLIASLSFLAHTQSHTWDANSSLKEIEKDLVIFFRY